jgi:hypothetical protein
MSLDSEEHKKKMSFFRQILRIQESVNGVFVQRIMANDLKRLLENPQDDDPVADALGDLDQTFRYCTNELGGNQAVLSSVESIVAEAADDKSNGENGEGCVLLVWKIKHLGGNNFSEAELVGIATLFRMKSCDSFSTLPGNFRGGGQYNTLLPYFRGRNANTINDGKTFPPGLGIKAKYMYIDVMCSKQKGVGKLLVLHAYRYAIMKKTKGLLALSFSKRALNAQQQPASYKIFSDLGFTTIIRNADYTTAMYGHWVAKSTLPITFKGVIDELGNVCTRSGYTERTQNNLIWRCPM